MADAAEDEDLADGIKTARKKACNFALICKGPEPVKLIIQKKPILDGAKAKAKAEFKGNAIISGVCVGGGSELEFQVVGEAGSEPSIKTSKLKEFISEQAGVTIKPVWKCFSALPATEPEEAVAPADPTAPVEPTAPVAVSPAAVEPDAPAEPPPAPPVPPPPPLSAGPEAKALLGMLNKLAPAIQTAVAANPGRKGDLIGHVAAFKQQVAGEDFETAKGTLKTLGGLLKELGALPGPTATPPAPVEPQSASPVAPVEPAPPVGNSLGERWKSEFGALETQYLAALKKADDRLASQMKVIFAFATEQAEAGAFERALKGLERLEPLVEQALATKGSGDAELDIATGIVAKRKFLIERWDRIPGELRKNLKQLKSQIEKGVPGEDSGELIEGIMGMLGEFHAEMKDKLDDSINQGDGKYTAAVQAIDAMRKRLKEDELIRKLLTSPIAKVDVERVFASALDEIEAQLA